MRRYGAGRFAAALSLRSVRRGAALSLTLGSPRCGGALAHARFAACGGALAHARFAAFGGALAHARFAALRRSRSARFAALRRSRAARFAASVRRFPAAAKTLCATFGAAFRFAALSLVPGFPLRAVRPLALGSPRCGAPARARFAASGGALARARADFTS